MVLIVLIWLEWKESPGDLIISVSQRALPGGKKSAWNVTAANQETCIFRGKLRGAAK